MEHQLMFLIFLFATFSTISGQGPAPAGPLNITRILAKAGQFNTFIRLLQTTQEASQINNQLNNSNQGLTMFAPTDSAFSSLPSGSLNSLTDQQKAELIQFHILPIGLSLTQFQTASNPLRTQAGSSDSGEFPLNVTTSGNQVNLTTGVDTTSVSNSIYTDGQLFVYQVDKVLLPLQLFGTSAPTMAPAPSPSKPDKATKSTDSSADKGGDTTVAASQGSTLHAMKMSLGISMAAAFFFMVL